MTALYVVELDEETLLVTDDEVLAQRRVADRAGASIRILHPQEIVLKDVPPLIVIPIVVRSAEEMPDPDTETRFANIELD